VPPDQASASRRSRAAWIVLTLVISLAIVDATLAPTPAPQRPDFVDALFASRAVVAAIRIAIVFAAGFLVLSVIALVAQRRWLTRVGPVEVSGRVSDLRVENQRLEEEVGLAHQAVEDLERKVAYSQQVIDREQGV
jgi:hypothetical protein